MTMRNERSNELVARGRHVKYLPVSWAYDNIISHPCFLSIILSTIYEKEGPTWLGKKLFDLFLGKGEVSHIHEEQDMSEKNVIESFRLGKGAKGKLEFQVHRSICNPFDMLHGGAAAMIAESSVHLQDTRIPKRYVSQLDLTYLSGIAVGKNGEIHIDTFGADDAVHGSIVNEGKVAVQFSVLFE